MVKTLGDVMSSDVTCATSDSDIQEIARLMVVADCGEIPIVNNLQAKNVIGVITDRDIVCRSLGVGRDPLKLKAKDCMSENVILAHPDNSLDEGLELMGKYKIRRLPIVDNNNFLCGIVSQGDLVRYGDEDEAIEMLQEVSSPSEAPSAIQ